MKTHLHAMSGFVNLMLPARIHAKVSSSIRTLHFFIILLLVGHTVDPMSTVVAAQEGGLDHNSQTERTPSGQEKTLCGSGLIDYTLYDKHNPKKVLRAAHFGFSFGLSNSCWNIVVRDLNPNAGITEVESSFDGSTTFFSSKISSRRFLTNPPAILREYTNVVAEAYPTDVPPTGFFPVHPIWLAVCSGEYFRHVNGGRVRPIWQHSDSRAFILPYFVHCQFNMLNGRLARFLKNARCFSDGTERAVDDAQLNLKPIMHYGPPYSKGFLRAQYTLLSTTVVNGQIAPREFRLTQYLPAADGTSSNQLIIRCEYNGVITNWGNTCALRLGRLEKRASVIDHRTMLLQPPLSSVAYVSDSDHWQPFSPGTRAYELYRARVAALPVGYGKRNRPLATFLLLSVAVTLPIAYYCIKTFYK